MKRLHIIGRKNHGKTTLVTELVAHLKQTGYRIGTIKHTHHRHELDTPGKDSHRHREAGAEVVGILSPSMNAVFWQPQAAEEGDPYDQFDSMLVACDLILVEGDSQTAAAKIEVWRSELGSQPLAENDPTVLAVVSDDAPASQFLTLPRSDVPALAKWILERLAIRSMPAPV
jgi:molybdopterin-guanine dinucleotide biosynthesis protein MobB